MARKRKSGTGTIRQRKDGRWEGRAVVGYDDKGLPKTKNVLAKTKHECQEKLTKLMETVGSTKSEKICADMPFGEWMDFWYQTYIKSGLRPATQNTYESTIYQHIIPQLGKIPLCQLTQKDLQQFYAYLKKKGRLVRTEQYGKGLSDRMVRMCHAKCRAALDQAVRENLIRSNPAVGCKLPPKRGREMQVLSRQELQRFLIQAKADDYFELFLLDLSTGLRRGELLALQWSDLDLDTGTLSVTKQVYEVNGKMQLSVPKTKASIRKLVLPPAVVEVFREYRKTAKSRWLFPSPIKEDEPIKPGSMLRRLQVILERAGCKKIRFHDLRHTFATMSLENEMDVKTLSAIIGHVSSATNLTNDIYVKYIRKDATDKQKMLVLRGTIVVFSVIAVALTLYFPTVLSLQMTAYTMYGAAITPAILFALFSKKVTPAAGIAGILVGGLATIVWTLMGTPYGIQCAIVAVPASVIAILVVSAVTPKGEAARSLDALYQEK